MLAQTTPQQTQTAIAAIQTMQAAPTPGLSGQIGVPCTTVIGGSCQVTGAVNGTWVKTGPGTYRVTVSGPANTAPGSTPQNSIPTTNGVETGTCTAVGSSAPFTTTCSGSMLGDAIDNATVFVNFGTALAGRPAGDVPPNVTGQVGEPPTCQPRPIVSVAVSPGSSGRLDVTITASTTGGGSANLVRAVRVGAATNATVQSSGQQGSSNFTITLAPRSLEVRLSVIRTTAGQASTVPIVVANACGEWQTLVGGGPTAF